jgi:hypothetical protein
MPQLENPALAPLLRHGTLRERFAAEVTGRARAQPRRLRLRRPGGGVRRAGAHRRTSSCGRPRPGATRRRLWPSTVPSLPSSDRSGARRLLSDMLPG